MKFLGIDFGTKRIGLALSDEDGKIAFPNEVLPNDANLLKEILKICADNSIGGIVIGESNDFAGNPNPIMKDVKKFIKVLEKETHQNFSMQNLGGQGKIPIIFEPEFLTSVQAARIQGNVEKLDASAAAIILQSYLDKIRNSKSEILNNFQNQNTSQVKNKISYEDFQKVEIKVGQILTAEKIPNTDKLLKLSVEFGEPTLRKIVSGISAYFPDPIVLVGKKCLFVTNLEPRVIKGEESNGMVLALSTPEGDFSLLEPNSTIPIGTKAK